MTDKAYRYGYMCGVDFQHEVGSAGGGNRVFPSIKDLRENYPCVEQCGIVKVRVELVEWLRSCDFDREIKERKTLEDFLDLINLPEKSDDKKYPPKIPREPGVPEKLEKDDE